MDSYSGLSPTKKVVSTDPATGFKEIHKHQAVIVLTVVPGKTWKGVILSPSPKLSLVRYNEAGTLRERRVRNHLLVPVRLKGSKDAGESESAS